MNPADLERALILCAIWAIGTMLYLMTALILDWRARRRIRHAAAVAPPARSAAEEIEDVAAAISRCYGHGPFRLLDRMYQDEFRRDARAAIAAIRRRGSS